MEEIENSFRTSSEDLLSPGLPYLQQYQEIDQVRIYPGQMVFTDAFEDTPFKQGLFFENYGKSKAIIRICQPNSQNFHVNSSPSQVYEVIPGLKLVKFITHIFRRSMIIFEAFLPICINKTWIDYKIYVTLSAPVITLEPDYLDFGRMDVCYASTMRKLTIRNTGTKEARFAIDLGRKDVEIIVEPKKGTISINSAITLEVQINSYRDGAFESEFWIKTRPQPVRVKIVGSFTTPKFHLNIFYSNCFDFGLLDFPRTYYGASATRILTIKNASSSNCMFVVMALVDNNVMSLKEAIKLDENYKSFQIKPQEGRIFKEKTNVVQVTFSPKKGSSTKKFSMCLLKIIRVEYQDIGKDAIFDQCKCPIAPRESSMSLFAKIQGKSQMPKSMPEKCLKKLKLKFSAIDSHQTTLRVCEKHTLDGLEETAANFCLNKEIIELENYRKICLHGDNEPVEFKIRPDLLILKDLTLNTKYNREILLKNQSRNLSLIFTYSKVPSITVQPNEGVLKPTESLEVKLTIRPSKMGIIKTKVKFDLYYPNFPIGSTFGHVGSCCLKVVFDTTCVDLIPHTKQCKTDISGVSKIEPDQIFSSTKSQIILKMNNRLYYDLYLKQNITTKHLTFEYELTNKKLLLLEGLNYTEKKDVPCLIPKNFIPLTPIELYNLRILPKFIKFHVCPHSCIVEHFTIVNMNNFPIRIYLKSTKSWLSFVDDSRLIIEENDYETIEINIKAGETTGKINATINVIINECHLYKVMVGGYVIPKVVKLENKEIEFLEGEGLFKLIELRNILNSPMKFEWILPKSCFNALPTTGQIPEYHNLFTMVTYTPHVDLVDYIECLLKSESGYTQTVQVVYHKSTKKPKIGFSTEKIDFNVIPLNIAAKKTLILRNFKNEFLKFQLKNPKPIEGIEVMPENGFVQNKGDQLFEIVAHFRECVEFSTTISFVLQSKHKFQVEITGKVEYPKLKIDPPLLNFQTIWPFAFDRLMFKIKNLSNCDCFIDFPFDLPEFSVTTLQNPELIYKLELKPKEEKQLYIYFKPMEICTYNFFLPYIINGLIGPPLNYNSETVHLKYYLKNSPDKSLPEKIPLVLINSCAKDYVVKFSHLEVNLSTIEPEKRIVICNPTMDTLEMCIKTDKLNESFQLTTENDVKINEFSHVFTLEPRKKIVYLLKFTPKQYGNYSVQLPVIIRGFLEDCVFNYLTINGLSHKPVIEPSKTIIYFEPVPLGVASQVSFNLTMRNHKENCALSYQCEAENIQVEFQGDNPEKEAVVSFEAPNPESFSCLLTISCDCDSLCKISVKGIQDNFLLTTHGFLNTIPEKMESFKTECLKEVSSTSIIQTKSSIFTNYNENNFPFFPENSNSVYGEKMRDSLTSLENWLFSQGFFSKKFYKIPEDFSAFPLVIEEKKKENKRPSFGAKKKPTPILPIVQLILNLAGNKLKEYIITEDLKSEDDLDRLHYTLKIYENILEILHQFQAYFPHIEPIFLLNFTQFCLFNNVIENPVLFTETEFYLLSKQCWMDLILQTIKVFVLKRLKILDQDPEPILSLYGIQERVLLQWLRKSYEKLEKDLWKQEKMPQRQIRNFLTDLRDGIVLGTVTVVYCPYLKDSVKEMFFAPRTFEEQFHNACKLVQVWKLLKMSFLLRPEEIIEPTLVQMVLLVSYLYEVLPNYCPIETIKITAGIGETGLNVCEIQNFGRSTIVYEPIFFENADKFFSIKNKGIKIKARRTVKLEVNYASKRIGTSKAILVLCGEMPGQKFGKTQAFYLEGCLDVTIATQQISIVVDLYKIGETKLKLQSPFASQGTFDVFYYVGDEPNNLAFWQKTGSVIFFEEKLNFDETGFCNAKPMVSCLEMGEKVMWVFFINPNVGDWCVKLGIKPRLSKDFCEQIQVNIPKDFDGRVCTCESTASFGGCPKLLQISIPCKNYFLCQAMKNMLLLRKTDESEYDYWMQILNTPTGFHVMGLLMNFSLDPTKITYKIKLNKECCFTTVKNFSILDTTSDDFTQLPIHFCDNVRDSEMIQMTSEDGKEINDQKYFLFAQEMMNRPHLSYVVISSENGGCAQNYSYYNYVLTLSVVDALKCSFSF